MSLNDVWNLEHETYLAKYSNHTLAQLYCASEVTTEALRDRLTLTIEGNDSRFCIDKIL
jgi:hypothetical protein